MNQQDYRKLIDTAIAAIADMSKDTPADAKMAELMTMGLALLGEVLIDIKRIADASEKVQHTNYASLPIIPEGYEMVQEGLMTVVRPKA